MPIREVFSLVLKDLIRLLISAESFQPIFFCIIVKFREVY